MATKKKPLPKPKSGGKPKKVTTKNKPGGSMTPGAKAARKAAAKLK